MNLAVFICVIAASLAEGYKILVFYPLPVRSINLFGEGTVKHLLDAGHEVTYVTSYPLKNNNHPNLRQIDISENAVIVTGSELVNISKLMEDRSQFSDPQDLQMFGIYTTNLAFEHERVQKFLQDTKEKFDVVIVDWYETEVCAGLAVLYDCPMIWSFSMGVQASVTRIVDERINPAYTSDYMSPNVPPFTFKQRLQELWIQIKWSFMKRFTIGPLEEDMYEKVFTPLLAMRGRKLPNFEDIMYNASLILVNEYSSAGNVPSTPQNLKFIAGQNIETPTKPLPQELQTLMDNSKHGVIYFSLGSTWQSKYIPQKVTEGLLKVFGELKQTVIWKYEADLKNLPANVHTLKWAPQHSILAHPNLLFFITHGGLMSSMEAVHFGVPIIGVPIFMDQFININKAVAKGYAISVELNFNLPSNLKSAIKMMLSDKEYGRKAKELSQIYHDRPVPPGKELVHWVEHVVRTRGAPHLRSPALHVPWYQKMYLDLAAIITVVLIVLKVTMKRLFCSRRKGNTEKKNK